MSGLRNALSRAKAQFRKTEFEAAFPWLQGRFSRAEDDFVRDQPHDKPYGCFVYPTTNVGDEIQSIAQMGFLPRNRRVLAVDREGMGSCDGPAVNLIANGWYLHNPSSWPPAPQLNPVFVSFHLSDDWQPDDASLQYLRDHGPIGCRDRHTVRRLEGYGVPAYFTGCMTLTLENPHPAQERSGVLIVDADLGYDGGYPPSVSTQLARLVPQAIRDSAVKIEQECPSTLRTAYARKFGMARALLERYARAKLVITTRLHCALPCRALGTPVVFLHANYEGDPRFDGLHGALQGYGLDATAIDIDWSNPAPADISEYRERVTAAAKAAMLAKWSPA